MGFNKTNSLQMWSSKSTVQIYGHTKALASIKRSPTDAAAQAMRAKYLVGAVKYMKNKQIEGFFVKQKKRIGVALDEIDKALPTVPTKNGLNPWQTQNLKTYWDTYMDDAFDKAKQRTENTMQFFIDNLMKKWVLTPVKQPAGAKGKITPAAKNDLIRQIKALRTEWTKTKRAAWTKPSW